jgi:hypothetical protein
MTVATFVSTKSLDFFVESYIQPPKAEDNPSKTVHGIYRDHNSFTAPKCEMCQCQACNY